MTREQAHDLLRQMVPVGKVLAAIAVAFTAGAGYQNLMHRFDRIEQGILSQTTSRRTWAVWLAVYNPDLRVPDPADPDFRVIDVQAMRRAGMR